MRDETKGSLERAIQTSADNASKATSGVDALQYTQAALNAAKTLIVISDMG